MFTPLVAAVALVPADLDRYVSKRDPATSWSVVQKSGAIPQAIRLTSQRWHGIDWKHSITIKYPDRLRTKGVVALHITGDRVGTADEVDAKKLADLSGVPVATLYNVPNQPIFGLREDALIAATFQRYMDTNDSTWPLLFPMTKSAIESMNAIESATKSGPNPCRRFVVFGGSKRGWTTWLAAATKDSRIIGFAPLVFDNLNIVEQMRQQKKRMGDYSPMIRDYVKAGLLATLESPKGKKLASLVDPLTYAPSISKPMLAIHGGHDTFWAPDASTRYWPKLAMPKSALVVPNAGHNLGDRKWAIAALGAFVDHVARGAKFPSVRSRIETAAGKTRFVAEAQGANPTSMTVYACTYYGWEFAKMPWRAIVVRRGAKSVSEPMARPQEGFAALIAVAEYNIGGRRFWLSSPTVVLDGLKSSPG